MKNMSSLNTGFPIPTLRKTCTPPYPGSRARRRPRRERHNYRHGRDPYYDDDGGCCCGGRRRRTVYVEPIYPYGAPVRPRPEAYAGYAHPV